MVLSANRRNEIDGLRAIAVAAVVLYHLDTPGISGGFVGVDVFFVISGYLITSIFLREHEQARFRFGDFYRRRILRIYPALIVTVLAALVVGFLVLSPRLFAETGTSAIAAAGSFSNVFFWREAGYFETANQYRPLLHTWSLGVEMQFYAIWPLCLLIASKLGANGRRLLVGLAIVIGYGLAELWRIRDADGAFYLLPARIPEFAIGSLVAIVPMPKNLPRNWLAAAGLILILWPILTYSSDTSFPGLSTLAPCLGTAMIIAVGQTGPVERLLSNSYLNYLGRTSYSIYLVHWPIIVLYGQISGKHFSSLDRAIIVTLSIFLGAALYYSVENRFSSSVLHQKFKLAMLAGAVAIIATIGMGIAQGAGWYWRIPTETATLVLSVADEKDRPDCRRVTLDGVDGRTCIIGDSSVEPIFALVGDSHAASLSNAIDVELKRIKQSALLINVSGVLPLYGARTYAGNTKKPQNYDNAINYLEQSNIEFIIIHARFALYWNTKSTLGEATTTIFVGSETAPPLSSSSLSRENFGTSFSATLDRFSQAEKQVLIVGAVPHLGVALADCLATPNIVVTRDCSGFSKDQALAEAEPVNNFLNQHLTGATLFEDPAKLFCQSSAALRCLRSQDGRLLYRDDNHLSLAGATLLADGLVMPHLMQWLDARKASGL